MASRAWQRHVCLTCGQISGSKGSEGPRGLAPPLFDLCHPLYPSRASACTVALHGLSCVATQDMGARGGDERTHVRTGAQGRVRGARGITRRAGDDEGLAGDDEGRAGDDERCAGDDEGRAEDDEGFVGDNEGLAG